MSDGDYTAGGGQSRAEGAQRVIGGRYRILKKLGSGAMGDVYLSEDSKLQRNVAVKSIRAERCASDEMLKRIKRECLLHAKIGAHPNIVALFDLVDDDDQIHLIMEYVRGETLEELMERHETEGSRLAPETCVSIVAQCLRALAHTHAHGIIHRDVKPANVILVARDSGEPSAKMMDFGIARLEADDPKAATLTREGDRSPGTPLYMAPEQIDSAAFGEVTPASDIYATGVMLYHLLAGRPPFRGTLTDIFNGHLNFRPKPITLANGKPLDPALMAAIEKALAKKPEDRYASAESFEQALDAAGEAPAIARAGRSLPAWAKWGSAAAVLLALGVAGLSVLRSDSDPGESEEESFSIADSGAGSVASVAGSSLESPRVVEIPSTSGAESGIWEEAVEEYAPPAGEVSATVDLALPAEPGATGELEESGGAPQPGFPQPILAVDAPEIAVETPAKSGAKPVELEKPAAGAEDGTANTTAKAAERDPPPDEKPKTYTVKSGDTIVAIANRFQIDKNDLAKWNLIERPGNISVGQVLYLYERPGLAEIEVDWGPETRESGGILSNTKDSIREGWKRLRGGSKKNNKSRRDK